MITLILFGPPGSGKGTQAAHLVEKYNLLHISTGDLFRNEIKNETPLGMEAKSYMDKGELVPDAVTIGMLRNKMDAHPDVKGFILDGFPRTTPQAEALNALLAERNAAVTGLLALDVPDEKLVERLLKRAETSGRSDDSDENVVRNRIEVYKEKTAVVADFYAQTGKTSFVNGVGSIEKVFERLCEQVDKFSAA